MSGGRRARPYYPNQRFKYQEGGYNFSSDVDIGNGSFHYGPSRPVQHNQSYSRGSHGYRGGGGSGSGYRGNYGNYNPHYYGGYEHRGRGGYRPPQRYRGGFPRRGGMDYGHQQWHHKARGGMGGEGTEDLFYNNFMFEDPWKNLMPSDEALDEDDDNMENECIGDDSYKEDNREGDVSRTDDNVALRGGEVMEGNNEEIEIVEGLKIDVVGDGEEVRNEEKSVVSAEQKEGVKEGGDVIKDEDTNQEENLTAGE